MDSLRRLTSSVFDSHARLGRRHSGSGISAFLPTGLGGADPASALDLTFITEQLIVCGFPVARASSKKANEINVDELAEYLETHHSNHYLIFNLNALDQSDAPSSACASPAYDSAVSSSAAPSLIEQLWKRTPQLSGSGASSPAADAHAIAAKVREQMLEFSWERDGMKAHTPPMDLIFRICYSIFAWLSLDAANVAVVNCETGKTRSGVVVACYLLFARLADDPIAAFVAFYRKRWAMRSLTPEALRSKTPPSIQRFLASFYALLELQKPPNDAPLVLKAIIFRALPVELQPCVQIWDDYRLVFCTDSASGGGSSGSLDDSGAPVLEWNGDDGFFAIAWEHGVELDGGFSILCSFGDEYDTSSSAGDDSDAGALDASSRVLFRYADSTWFLTPGVVTLSKRQLDMMKQYEHGFDDDHFSVDLVLHAAGAPAPAAARPSHVRLDYTGNHAVRQGLLEITKHHVVLPDPAMHSNFLRMGFGETPTTFALQRSQNAPNVALDLLHSDMLAACFGRPETQATVATDASGAVAPTLSTSASPLRRQTTAEIVAMQSQRSRYASATLSSAASSSASGDACTCVVCNDDDYMLRPQLVQCSGACSRFYHTTCAGLRKIPFGLTTLSDRTNHSVYVKKFFSAWECDACAPAAAPVAAAVAGTGAVPPGMTLVPTSWAKSYSPGAAPVVPIERATSIGAAAPSDFVVATTSDSSQETSEAAKLDKLREFLLASGVSVDDLLRAATTPNVAIAPTAVSLGADSGGAGAALASTAPTASPARPGTAAADRTAPCVNAETPANDPASATRASKTEPLSGADAATSPRQEPATASASAFPLHMKQDASVAPSERSGTRSEAPGTSDAAAVKSTQVPPATAAAGPRDARSDLMAQIAARAAPKASAAASPAPLDRNAALLRDIVAKRGPKSDGTAASDAPEARAGPASGSSSGESKYEMMLKRGVPFAAVQNCMVKDGADPSTLSPLPESTESPVPPPAPRSVRLRDVDEFKSYFEMLRLGCPKDAVKHKLIMDGLDPLVVDFGPDALYDDAMRDKLTHAVPLEARSRLQDDITGVRAPRSQRAEAADAAAATVAQAEPSEQAAGPEPETPAPLPSPVEAPSSPDADGAVLLRDHEVYGKYFKMLKMRLPEDAVRHKIKTDGADEQALALGGDATYAQLIAASAAAPTLGDDPVYAKYFKMLKMGLPDGAVRHKMAQDGADARALDLGPDALVSALVASRSTGPGAAPSSRKPPPRRKKLHWQAISDDRLRSLHQQTIWEDRGDDEVAFDMDMDELESLFFANADASGSSKKKASQSKALQRKQSVTLIDAKRAMNAAISLARVKLSHREIADAVETFDAKGLTLEQLVGISEFLPTAEEAALVAAYTGDVAVLGEAEKFMREMARVQRCASRMECLVFQLAFPSRSAELTASFSNMHIASEEVKGSRLLKVLLSMVLKLGNTLNGSGDASSGIRGFTVDSLLRLGHTKAVNQKTTVLHYLVRLVKKNHPQVLDFSDELKRVPLAARESFDTIHEDFAKLQASFAKLQAELALLETTTAAASVATLEAMRAAVAGIAAQIAALAGAIERARDEVRSVFDYFGEDPNKNPTDFFATLTSFCSAFEAARKEVDAADEAALRAERMKLRRSNSAASRPQRRASLKDASDLGGATKDAAVASAFQLRLRDRTQSERSGALATRPSPSAAAAGT